MRLFVAIDLSKEIKTAATGLMHDLKKAGVKGNYVPSQNLHLTLAFIGEARADEVKAALAQLEFKSFRLTLSELGTFGDVLWVGTKGTQGLSGLARDVRRVLDAADIGYDTGKFVPHITLVRKCAGRWQGLPVPKEEMTVRKVSLMRSEQKDGKTVYTEIFAVNCK